MSLQESLAKPELWRAGGLAVDTTALQRLYMATNYRPLWTGSGQAQKAAQAALEALIYSDNEGLSPDDYHVKTLARLQAGKAPMAFEFLLSDSLMRYAHDMRVGRVSPNDVDEDVDLPAKKFDAATVLANAANQGKIDALLAGLEPAYPDYMRLKAALARYRRLAMKEWPAVSDTKTLDHKDILRARLMVEDETLRESATGAELQDALKRYQRRNGLEPDGILGPKTLASLNVPAAERIAQITANMERWRWLPDRLESRYVMVNTADATLDAIENGKVILHSKVVVGSPDKRTPILRTAATAITVNPVWRIPKSIAQDEILPELQKDPSYLEKHNMVLAGGPKDDPTGLRVDWSSVTEFRYMVQQVAGPDNALGTLKLEMPNKFEVYLHDTPGKYAFTQNARALSHGCVRVEAIGELASFAWKGDPMSGLEELHQLIANGETKRVSLDEKLPVYLLYWTVRTDDDGVGLLPDVYGRDALLARALRGDRVMPRPLTELSI